MTVTDVLQNCLFASVVHAIMTNMYPDFAYEQSWSGNTYSVIGEGVRGSITFGDGLCVGAVRHEVGKRVAGRRIRRKLLKGFPPAAIRLLEEQTFPFLLLDQGRRARPVITGAFWGDRSGINFSPAAEKDLLQLLPGFFSFEQTADCCRNTYELEEDGPVMGLAKELTERKMGDFNRPIRLTERELARIPGEVIRPECAESLSELGIFQDMP